MFALNIFGNRSKNEALCATCTHAHVEKGFRGEVLTLCHFAYPMRVVAFAVCECTDYCDRRSAKPVKIAGFVKTEREEVSA